MTSTSSSTDRSSFLGCHIKVKSKSMCLPFHPSFDSQVSVALYLLSWPLWSIPHLSFLIQYPSINPHIYIARDIRPFVAFSDYHLPCFSPSCHCNMAQLSTPQVIKLPWCPPPRSYLVTPPSCGVRKKLMRKVRQKHYLPESFISVCFLPYLLCVSSLVLRLFFSFNHRFSGAVATFWFVFLLA